MIFAFHEYSLTPQTGLNSEAAGSCQSRGRLVS